MGIKISNTDIADIKIGGVSALRVMRGGQEVWSGIPDPVRLTSTIDETGQYITHHFNVPIFGLVENAGDWSSDLGGAHSYVTGLGTQTLIYELETPVVKDAVDVGAFLQPGDGLQNSRGALLMSEASFAIVNGSEYAGIILPDIASTTFPTGLAETWRLRLDVTIPAAELPTQLTAGFVYPLDHRRVPLWWWDWIEEDGRSIRPRRASDVSVALPHTTVFIDKVAKKQLILIKVSSGAFTASQDFTFHVFFGNPEATSTASANDVWSSTVGWAFHAPTSYWTGRIGAWTLHGADPASADMFHCGGVSLDGVSTTGAYLQAADQSSFGTLDQLLRISIKVPATPINKLILSPQASNGFRGTAKDLVWVDDGGALKLRVNFGESRSLTWTVPPEYWGTEARIRWRVRYTSSTNLNTVRDYMDVSIENVDLGLGVVSASADLLTYNPAFGGTWRIGRSGVDSSASRGFGNISMLHCTIGSANAILDGVMEDRLLYESHTFSEVDARVNVSFSDGPTLAFTLDTEAVTTGEIYSTATGRRARRVWAGVTYPAGTHSRQWDLRDDFNQLAPAGEYEFRLTKHSMSATWEGVIGVSSVVAGDITHSAPNPTWRCFWNWGKIAFTADEGIVAMSFNEQQPPIQRFALSSIQKPKPAAPQNFRYACIYAATDGTLAYTLEEYHSVSGDAGHPILRQQVSARVVNAAAAGNLASHTFASGSGTRIHLETSGTKWNGIAVQQDGDILAVCSVALDIVRFYHKTTGAFIGDVAMGDPRHISVDPDDNFVLSCVVEGDRRIARISAPSITNDIAYLVAGLATHPLDIAVRLSDGQIAAYLGGGAAYVQLYNAAGAPAGTVGEVGGMEANGPVVTDYRFDPITIRQDNTAAMLAYDLSDRLWVGDFGHSRVMVYDGTTYEKVDAIYTGLATYSAHVSNTEPAKVYRHNLQYEVTYGDNIEDSWALIRNWRYHNRPKLPKYQRIAQTRRFDDGVTSRTLALIPQSGTSNYRVMWLPDDGSSQAIDTGVSLPSHDTSWDDATGALVEMQRDDGANVARRRIKAFLGFTGGVPAWAASWTVTHTFPRGATDPNMYAPETAGAMFNAINGPRWPVFADGSAPIYRGTMKQEGEPRLYHVGAVAAGGSAYIWRAGESGWWTVATSTPTRLTNPFGRDVGTFDELWATYSGNRMTMAGNILAVGHHGEFSRGGQTGVFTLYDQDGTALIAFGTPFKPTENYVAPYPEWAGNAFNPSLIEVGGVLYLYCGDEGGWSSVHRWRIEGHTSIAKSVIDTFEVVSEE